MGAGLHRRWRLIDLALSIALVLVIAGMVWASWYPRTADAGMIAATSTVTRSDSQSTTVTFRGPNDELVTVDLHALNTPPLVGTSLRVVYPPAQPTAARLPNTDTAFPAGIALFAFLVLIGTMEAFLRQHRSLRLLAQRADADPIVIEPCSRKSGDVVYIWPDPTGPPDDFPVARVRTNLSKSGLSEGDVCDASIVGQLRTGRVVVIWIDDDELYVTGRVKRLALRAANSSEPESDVIE